MLHKIAFVCSLMLSSVGWDGACKGDVYDAELFPEAHRIFTYESMLHHCKGKFYDYSIKKYSLEKAKLKDMFVKY